MKTIKLNFKKWSSGANNGSSIHRVYKRIYFKKYWTPFVVVTWSKVKKHEQGCNGNAKQYYSETYESNT